MKTVAVNSKEDTAQNEQKKNSNVSSKIGAKPRKKTKGQERREAKAKYLELVEQIKDASKIAYSFPTDFKRRSKRRQNELERQRNREKNDDMVNSLGLFKPTSPTDVRYDAVSPTSAEVIAESNENEANKTSKSVLIETSASINRCETRTSNLSVAGTSESNPNVCFSEDFLEYMGHKITISLDDVEVSLTKIGYITMRGLFYLHVLSGKVVINGYKCKEGAQLKIVCPQSGLHLNITGFDSKEGTGIFKLLPMNDEDPYMSLTKGISMYRRFKNLFNYKVYKNMERAREEAPSDSAEALSEAADPKVSFFFNKDDLVQHDKVLMYTLESVVENSERRKICVCGPKNSGKSTTSIFLANALISGLISKKKTFPKVYWLDCDVGQPEFTLPGCVSVVEISEPILGSHFCHMQMPLKSFYVGAINIADIVEIYLNALEKLVEYLNTLDHSVPILVNMPGWIEVGLGLEITSNILRIIQPHYVIQYKMEGDENVVELDCHKINECDDLRLRKSNKRSHQVTKLTSCSFELEIIPLENRHQKNFLSAMEERHLRVLAYFYQNMFQHSSYNEEVKNLLDFPRKKVSFLGKALEVMPMNHTMNPKLILMAMNMTVVAFCSLQENSSLVEPLSMHNGSFFVSSWDCQKLNHRVAIGYGIITEIDKDNCTAFVITPLSDKQLSKCEIISKGSVPIPDCCLKAKNDFWRTKGQHGKARVYSGQRYQEPPYMSMLYPKDVFGAGDPKRRTFGRNTDFVSGT